MKLRFSFVLLFLLLFSKAHANYFEEVVDPKVFNVDFRTGNKLKTYKQKDGTSVNLNETWDTFYETNGGIKASESLKVIPTKEIVMDSVDVWGTSTTKVAYFKAVRDLCIKRGSKMKVTKSDAGYLWAEPVDEVTRKIAKTWFNWDGRKNSPVSSILPSLVDVGVLCLGKEGNFQNEVVVRIMGAPHTYRNFGKDQTACREFGEKLHKQLIVFQNMKPLPVIRFNSNPPDLAFERVESSDADANTDVWAGH